ncbi:hypothetical protein EJD97_012727 [Solanum chilense]|uniref:DUF3511 domain-containing protein n=1 Tax=Solanum chilense TaxID=4083 RepID=A0A6N2CCM7_SOLCI|nr:hypothetical protein EJD97_012727 [Solanum chilense]
MENFRSKSTRERRGGPISMQDLRSCSTNSHATTSSNNNNSNDYKEVKMKRSKSKVISSSSLKNWSFNDPEMQRKKRVVGYKAYGVEGKMKVSLRKSFKWIKNTCNHVVHGLW